MAVVNPRQLRLWRYLTLSRMVRWTSRWAKLSLACASKVHECRNILAAVLVVHTHLNICSLIAFCILGSVWSPSCHWEGTAWNSPSSSSLTLMAFYTSSARATCWLGAASRVTQTFPIICPCNVSESHTQCSVACCSSCTIERVCNIFCFSLMLY